MINIINAFEDLLTFMGTVEPPEISKALIAAQQAGKYQARIIGQWDKDVDLNSPTDRKNWITSNRYPTRAALPERKYAIFIGNVFYDVSGESSIYYKTTDGNDIRMSDRFHPPGTVNPEMNYLCFNLLKLNNKKIILDGVLFNYDFDN